MVAACLSRASVEAKSVWVRSPAILVSVSDLLVYPGHVFYATIGATIGSAETRKAFAASKTRIAVRVI